MLRVVVASDSLQIGEHCSISFLRTLHIANDGRTYSVPSELGRFAFRC